MNLPLGFKGKRRLLAEAMTAARAIDLCEKLDRRHDLLVALAYHRIGSVDSASYRFDEHLISTSVDEFDWQLRRLKTHFDVLTFEQLGEALGSNHVPRRTLVITFDDGYRDNFTHAFPVLQLHGLPAVFYLTTGHIGTTDPFWFEKIVYWIRTHPRDAIDFGIGTSSSLPLGESREQTLQVVRDTLKSVPWQDHEALMLQLQDQYNGDIVGADRVATMSWDEIREMRRAGMEFGAHSVAHVNLTAVSDERLNDELRNSKAEIERQTGCRVVSVSYPGGRYDPRVIRAARDVGFDFGAAFVHGVNSLSTLDRFVIKRIAIETDVTGPLFRAMMRFPATFGGRRHGGS